MAIKGVETAEQICSKCKPGLTYLEEIKKNGHQNALVFYEAMFKDPGKFLVGNCPKLNGGLCGGRSTTKPA